MITTGYERLAGPQPREDAVAWWYVEKGDGGLDQFPPTRQTSGFAFARGGRVATCREARRQIASCRAQASRERLAWRVRPTHRLTASGAVEALQ